MMKSSLVILSATMLLTGAVAGIARHGPPVNAPGVNPFGTFRLPGQLPGPGVLADPDHVFGYIAETLHLGKRGDADLLQRLEAASAIDHLHDYRGEAIYAVKPELIGADGESLVRGADGNYPFFVFRQSEHGWLLIGRMDGTGYDWSTQTRHLVFNTSVLTGKGSRTTVRYEVNPAYLVNLNELARTEHESDKVKADWHMAF
jgi:hypothetical protein